MSDRTLTPLEARVLAVLVEKQHTVPDSYPLSLNALTMGCNQKTARDPVMQASDAEVLQAIDGLKEQNLIVEVSGSRVVRFEHNTGRAWRLPSQSVALLALLMLRGPQTAAELRLHTERLHRFADTGSVEVFLEELATREPPLTAKLARAPGEREQRWAHLACGEVQAVQHVATAPAAAESAGSPGEVAALRAEVEALRSELAQVRQLAQRLARELGLPSDEA